MDSSATLTHHPKHLAKQCHSAATKHPSSRRTLSFSSSSSSLSPYNSSSSLESLYFAADDDPIPHSPVRFSGVPFSWEHLPGIPKKQTSLKKKLQESSIKLLPLPPPTNTTPITSPSPYNYKKKNSLQSTFQRDPFFAAMVECSKDDGHEEEEEITTATIRSFWNNTTGRGGGSNNKVPRSISDRFGFINLYSSCKNASAVSESIIYLPSSRRSRINLQHFNRRSL